MTINQQEAAFGDDHEPTRAQRALARIMGRFDSLEEEGR